MSQVCPVFPARRVNARCPVWPEAKLLPLARLLAHSGIHGSLRRQHGKFHSTRVMLISCYQTILNPTRPETALKSSPPRLK